MLGYIFLFVIAICHSIHSGFAAGTLVKVPTGYKTIESIRVGDIVSTMKGQTSEVVGTVSYYGPHIVRIVFKESFLDTTAQQKLYTFPQHMWTKACSLSSVDSAYSNRFGGIEACIKDIQIIHQEMQFFDIRLKEHHAFYVTEQEILVHNFPCFSIFLHCTPAVYEGVYAGLCCAGIWLGAQLLKLGRATTLVGKDQQSSYRKNILVKKKKKMSMNDLKEQLLQRKYAITSTGELGPDPDEDEEDEAKQFFKNLVKNAKREAFVQPFGKFYKDPKTNLWWSKDRGFHGGPHYKVFKEVETGFEWIFNADVLGRRIIGQHKGHVGRFISYKNIRFLQ